MTQSSTPALLKQEQHDEALNELAERRPPRKSKAMKWQTIDSAPRDGTPILAFAGVGGAFEECYGKARVAVWWDGRNWSAYGPAFGDPDPNRQRAPQRISQCSPSHWMPLPDPPE